MKRFRRIAVGDRVVVRDACGRLLVARVVQVPSDWRDASGSLATTVRGAFPKAWARLRPGGGAVPWPVEFMWWPHEHPEAADLVDARTPDRKERP